uniref:Uncharacterized protein n=1 Tax=Oryzias latipes TaxID=8090 RepID=A0A3B3ILW6_ORYLA
MTFFYDILKKKKHHCAYYNNPKHASKLTEDWLQFKGITQNQWNDLHRRSPYNLKHYSKEEGANSTKSRRAKLIESNPKRQSAVIRSFKNKFF